MSEHDAFENAGLGGLFDLSFRRFITLGVVKLLYILLLALAVVMWLAGVISALRQGFGPFVLGLIVMTLLVLIQVIVWRVMLELVVVLFRIGENTTTLVQHKTPGPEAPPHDAAQA